MFFLISFLIVSKVLSIVIIARIFLRIDKSIIGLRFFTGPLGLPGFGSGINCPKLNYIGLLPVFAIWFNISANDPGGAVVQCQPERIYFRPPVHQV